MAVQYHNTSKWPWWLPLQQTRACVQEFELSGCCQGAAKVALWMTHLLPTFCASCLFGCDGASEDGMSMYSAQD